MNNNKNYNDIKYNNKYNIIIQLYSNNNNKGKGNPALS